MKILLTGATGYIGKRILPLLIERGHEVVCCTRDKSRFNPPQSLRKHLSVIEIDLLDESTLYRIPEDIDAAYYLVHSMTSSDNFSDLEEKSAVNFRKRIDQTSVQQVIYLTGIVNETELSEHLSSRMTVENELGKGDFHLTALRAGIIIGSGSASFEIMRDLVEKLPVMVTPKWVLTKCEPIGITDVQQFLIEVLGNEQTYDRNFDIGCKEIYTYKEMLLILAEVRNLKRKIYTVPVMTPRLSSYWLYFVTATSYKLAIFLVDSMKIEVVCRDHELSEILGIPLTPYREALERAFKKIEMHEVVSSWKDSFASSNLNINVSDFIQIPTHGCFVEKRIVSVDDRESSIDKVWAIGGDNGWYYGNWLWKIRGFLDKLSGGVGLRRGRTNPDDISVGDSLDFWRVLYADKEEGRLLLIAEMKLPGEAWLEFKMQNNRIVQTATFRPLGLAGRLYWYSLLPFHGFIFGGMIKRIAESQ